MKIFIDGKGRNSYNMDLNYPAITLDLTLDNEHVRFAHELGHYLDHKKTGKTPVLGIIPHGRDVWDGEVSAWCFAVRNLPLEEKESVMKTIKICLERYAESTDFSKEHATL